MYTFSDKGASTFNLRYLSNRSTDSLPVRCVGKEIKLSFPLACRILTFLVDSAVSGSHCTLMAPIASIYNSHHCTESYVTGGAPTTLSYQELLTCAK